MLLHQRANHTDQTQRLQKINMHVTISQYETSSKNQICPVKVQIPSEHDLHTREKNSMEQEAFWHEVKVVCCLLTPFLHSCMKLITFQCIHKTDNLISNYKVCLQAQTESLFTGQNLLCKSDNCRRSFVSETLQCRQLSWINYVGDSRFWTVSPSLLAYEAQTHLAKR